MPEPARAGVILDVPAGSDLTIAQPRGIRRHSLGVEGNTSSAVVRQRFMQFEDFYNDPPMGTLLPGGWQGLTCYYMHTEAMEDLDGGLVAFDYVYAAVPGNVTDKVSVVKNYQAAAYTFNADGSTAGVGIISWSATIKADRTRQWFRGTGPAMPVVPTLMLISYPAGGQTLTDNGTGFPTGTVSGHAGAFTNNQAYSFITGAVEQYMGDIYCLTTISGA